LPAALPRAWSAVWQYHAAAPPALLQFLLGRAKELMYENLNKLREMAKEKIEEKKEEDDREIKNKHWVK